MENLHCFYRVVEFQLSGFDHQERKAKRSGKDELNLDFSSFTQLKWLLAAGQFFMANWKVATRFFNLAQ